MKLNHSVLIVLSIGISNSAFAMGRCLNCNDARDLPRDPVAVAEVYQDKIGVSQEGVVGGTSLAFVPIYTADGNWWEQFNWNRTLPKPRQIQFADLVWSSTYRLQGSVYGIQYAIEFCRDRDSELPTRKQYEQMTDFLTNEVNGYEGKLFPFDQGSYWTRDYDQFANYYVFNSSTGQIEAKLGSGRLAFSFQCVRPVMSTISQQ